MEKQLKMKEVKEQTLAAQARFAELNATIRKAVADGQVGFGDLCADMGVAPAYLRSLLHGTRMWSGIKPNALRVLARALNKPAMWVMVRAGRVAVEDFFTGPAQQAAGDIYEQIVSHPEVAAYVPDRATWDASPEPMRQAFVLLFNAGVNAQRLAA